MQSSAGPGPAHQNQAGAAPADGPTRVLFVVGTLDVGGAESQLVELAMHLAPRFAPAVCCLSASGPLAQRLTDAGIPVTPIGLRGLMTSRGMAFLRTAILVPVDVLRFLRFVWRSRPDVIHGFLPHGYVLAALVGAVARVPVIIASRRSLSHYRQGRRLLAAGERMANRLTTHIVANSEAVREDAVRTEGLTADQVSVIYNGLDLSRYSAAGDSTLRHSVELGPGPVAIVVANFLAYKGHADFLTAWHSVCRRHPTAVALLVGDGPERARCEHDAAALGLTANTRFLGSRTDVPRWLALADVLVHPSHEEGFCNAIIEGMAAAKPVIATDVGGNREAVVPLETGWLVPPKAPAALTAAMLDAFATPEASAQMGAAGRRRVEAHFQRARMVHQYEGLYDTLLSSSRKVPSRVRHRRHV